MRSGMDPEARILLNSDITLAVPRPNLAAAAFHDVDPFYDDGMSNLSTRKYAKYLGRGIGGRSATA